MSESLPALLTRVRACTLCEDTLSDGARPVVQAHEAARILIASQAPGAKVHATGIPFNDPSGDTLRTWMGVDRTLFYDPEKIAIVPMAFCFPGRGRSGDKPPDPRCAPTWRDRLLKRLPNLQLTLVIGQYAQAWYWPADHKGVTETVRQWQSLPTNIIPMPHPSPRNRHWLKNNPWFEDELLPVIRARVQRALARGER